MIAVDAGLEAKVSDLIHDLDDGPARARVWWARAHRDGLDPTQRTRLLHSAGEALIASRTWRPMDGVWLRRDDALSAVGLALAVMPLSAATDPQAPHDRGLGLVQRMSAALTEDTPLPRAQLAVARLGTALGGRAAATEERWRAASNLIMGIPDVRQRVRVARAYAQVACLAHTPNQVLRLWSVPQPNAEAQSVLGQALAEELASAGHIELAAALWSETVDRVESGMPVNGPSTALLCVLAKAQEASVGQVVAELTWSRTVRRVARQPLPSDPRTAGPWPELLRQGLARPDWSTRLRRALRAQPVLPPPWAFALALLDLRAGFPERTRSTARALEASQRTWGQDPEPTILAAVLRAELGELRQATTLMGAVLSMSAGQTVALPHARASAEPVEQIFVSILAAHGGIGQAVHIARTVQSPGLRADLLAQLAATAVRCGGAEPRQLAVEAEAALRLSHGDTPGSGGTLGAVVGTLWALGEAPLAMRTLKRHIAAYTDLPTALWSHTCATVYADITALRATGLETPLIEALKARVSALTRPEVRLSTLMPFLQAAVQRASTNPRTIGGEIAPRAR